MFVVEAVKGVLRSFPTLYMCHSFVIINDTETGIDDNQAVATVTI